MICNWYGGLDRSLNIIRMLGIAFKTLIFSSHLLIELSSRWMGLLSFFIYVRVYSLEMCLWSFICACFENLKHIKHCQKNSSVYLSGECVSRGIFFSAKGDRGFIFQKTPPHCFLFLWYLPSMMGIFCFLANVLHQIVPLDWSVPSNWPCVWGCLFQEHRAPWVLPYLQETKIVVLRFSNFVSFVMYLGLQFLQL